MGIVEILGIVKLILPYILSLIDLLKKSPAEKRAEIMGRVHEAIKKAVETSDTSDLEKLFRDGRPK